MKQKKDIIACCLAAFCVVAGAAYVGLCRAPVECATESMTAIPVALDSHRDTFGEQPLRVCGANAVTDWKGPPPDAPASERSGWAVGRCAGAACGMQPSVTTSSLLKCLIGHQAPPIILSTPKSLEAPWQTRAIALPQMNDALERTGRGAQIAGNVHHLDGRLILGIIVMALSVTAFFALLIAVVAQVF